MAEPPPQKLTVGRSFCHNTRQMTTFCVIDFHETLIDVRVDKRYFLFIFTQE